MQTNPTKTEFEDLVALLDQGFREGDPEMTEALNKCDPKLRDLFEEGISEMGMIRDNFRR
jgi:hypothetical protein